MASPAETHDAMANVVWAQRARLFGQSQGDRWEGLAFRFRDDPDRRPERILRAIARNLRPADVLLDIGGGAGRYGLPLARRCRETIVVDPSAAMQVEFNAAVAAAKIDNARFVHRDWLEAGDIEGSVSLVSHVTYFVTDIARFLDKLIAATSRRVMIVVAAVPPPNRGADLYAVLHGEEQALAPSYRELLPVLWQAGGLPEVRVIAPEREPTRRFRTRDEAIEAVLPREAGASGGPREKARDAIERDFDRLFLRTPRGFERATRTDERLLLLSWDTR